ncbi:glutaredoxin family protein [Bacillus sp. DNRA2]|uniref:glutaredoxin family protein n=1 Tax=Bacillus sp. DNRA2 TaxID=2723053 RepID=UPI00145E3447|nr:glutaredoxin family protein [Bacillus sp. DNRA2]
MSIPVITLYSREKCHLCEDAKAAISDLQSEFDFILEEVDIDTEDRLTELYGLMIPVVVMDGEEVQYGQVDKNVIRKRLQKK